MPLSLAVAAASGGDAAPFLTALEAAGTFGRSDVTVHIAHDEALTGLPEPLPENVHLHACASGTSVLRLWGHAIAASDGESVAVLDIRSPPESGWLVAALDGASAEWPLFFGPVDPGWPPNDPRIIGYVVEYAQFHAPLDPHLDEVPGNNVVCRRTLMPDDDALRERGFFKTFMVWRLRSETGLEPRGRDDMIVTYRKPWSLSAYVCRRWLHGRCFGATRHDSAGQPARLLCAVFTPLLPLLRVARIRRACRRHAGLRAAFRRHVFAILVAECAWSAGEFAGYVAGGRACCDRLD